MKPATVMALALFASAAHQAVACDWNHEAAAAKDTVVADCANGNCKAVPDESNICTGPSCDKAADNIPAATNGISDQPATGTIVADCSSGSCK